MGGHHLVLGQLCDYLTSETRIDTHDERYRQKIARLLVEEKGYRPEDLKPRVPIRIRVRDRQARVPIDIVVYIDGQIAMLVKYAPGSLTTRHQVALAASRLLAPYQVPFGVVTNGEDAEVLDNHTVEVVGRGLDGIFHRHVLAARAGARPALPVAPRQRDLAARILYAYEVDGRCPCDDTICDVALP